ncbi:PAS domain-containing protein [Haloferax sp. S1W]|uniref:sensor histidine kinase n=1 Tax=Haloferax sp. S1W TaxID=3377110 RepID=UPI0037CBBEF7
MTGFGDGLLDNLGTDDLSIVEYALQITDTVIWVWDVESGAVVLYPPSQTIFDEITTVSEFLSQVHPADQQAVTKALEVALEETGTYLTKFRLAGDENRWITAKGVVEYDESGEPLRLVGVGKDTSERIQHEREVTRLGRHIEETEAVSDIGGWELNLETNELLWTDGTKRIHEVPPDYEPTLEDAVEFYHPEDRHIIEDAVRACREYGDPYNVELRLITAEGRERWVNSRGERTRRGETETLRGVVRDITEQKIRDQRLMVLNRVLRHNIRNSLGVVMGNADLLSADIDALECIDEAHLETADFSIATTQSRIEKIRRNAEQLVELAEQARRLSRILERGQKTHYVDAAALAKRVATKFEDQHPTVSVQSEGRDAGVYGNTEALELALTELLENAILHNSESSPTIEISVSKLENGRVEIRVADTGTGIPEVEQNVLKQGVEEPLMHGHGMGLWMVNWLLVRLGGSVAIEDNDPHGTVVILKLPAAAN